MDALGKAHRVGKQRQDKLARETKTCSGRRLKVWSERSRFQREVYQGAGGKQRLLELFCFLRFNECQNYSLV